ncbi:hypothetical protein BDV41DRAFT_571721 [Aspergillus transmontanensis]|uniref:Uncharacterized protein n=1 Tax=Aspergillus transmontanensis TaxID=1034304 RepID=A0A5N6WD69_9EURO|nr:hypothetical protein BDV41DRAFT_571721 [Aspergillus transmontanensis]
MSILTLPQTLPPSTSPTQTIDRYEPSWYQRTHPDDRKQLAKSSKTTPISPKTTSSNISTDLPYPCIGVFRFLDFGTNLSPIYPEVNLPRPRLLLRTRHPQTRAQRHTIREHHRRRHRRPVPDLGYKLFRDRETLKARFYAASVFDEDFLSLSGMGLVVAQLVKLLRKRPGSVVFGRNLGVE